MCANNNDGLGFCKNGTRSNISNEMEDENNILENSMAERNEDMEPILDYGPSNLDAPPNDELMYIHVIILEVCI